jgi:serine-type D-Ala-D-Ala carboxypeptidase/endopeptidase
MLPPVQFAKELLVAKSFWRWPIILIALSLAACDGDDDPVIDPFAAVDAAARASFEAHDISGMGLAIYKRDGSKVFEKMYGDFSPDRRVAIASASKLVSGVTLFRLIDQGYLSLDSTTGETLGWTGDHAGITLRQLLSFTSGLPPENRCTYQVQVSLADCVELIRESTLLAEPGTRFDYGSAHLAVAGRMAEAATGLPWSTIFADQILAPLGLPGDIQYYSNPLRPVDSANPLLAGGLRISMNEYERVLHLVFDKGVWSGTPLLGSAIFDTQAMTPYPDAVIGRSPARNAPNTRYGLTAWLECTTPATGCSTLSSPGVFGFTPWLDRAAAYYAILGMEVIRNPSATDNFAVALEQQLQPLITQALAGS